MSSFVMLSHEYFMSKLQEQHDYLTDYQKETTFMALESAKMVDNPDLFLCREQTLVFVKKSINADECRTKDIAKMLSVLFKRLHLKANSSEDTKTELARRKANLKPRKLVPATQPRLNI